jgi:hypothetical protein
MSAKDVEESPLFAVFGFTLVLVVPAAVGSLILRFRRSRGAERQQLKWFAFAATLIGISFVPSVLVPAYERSAVSGLVFGFVIWLIPLSCGIAILRYRLYDIDRIINKTLVYGLLTALLGGAYAGVVFGIGGLVSDNSVVVAVATLIVAALFRPARARVQALIDRRFYRRRYDAGRTLEAFSARLRQEIDLDALSGELVGAVRETMQPVQASLWLRDRGLGQ